MHVHLAQYLIDALPEKATSRDTMASGWRWVGPGIKTFFP
jgi:hypothetical protein